MGTWLYDEAGRASAILDEFCLRTAEGEAAGFVFGLSAFSLKGEHIGWFEDGVLYDVENRILGFLADASGMVHDFPALLPPPPEPPFGKRPTVPTLRARPVRRPAGGWSRHRLDHYLADYPSDHLADHHADSVASPASAAVLPPPPMALLNDLPG